MKKLLLFDVDGTLIDYDGTLTRSTKNAISKARENGNLAVIVTGRSRSHIEEPILEIGFDGIVGGNGAYIELNNKIIKDETIPVEDVKRIVDYLNHHHLEYYIEANDGLYGSQNFKERGVGALKQYGMKNPDVMEIYPTMIFPKNLYVENVTKINYILESYQDYLDFKKAFPEFKDLTWGGKGEKAIFGDCALKHIDKQEAIKEIIDYLKINKEIIFEAGEDGIIGLFVFVGLTPQTDLFKGLLNLDEKGYIKTNEKMETNIKGVYAVGDCRVKDLRQVITASNDGAIAAINVEKYIG